MAGRPRTPIGSWGDISVTTLPSGTFQARSRYRDADGRLRRVTASARSATAAKRSLQDKLAKRTATASTSADGVTSTTTVGELCPYWLTRKEKLRPQSKDDYFQTITGSITPQIGDITLEEITPGRIARFLESVPAGVRPRARTILAQAFALAVSHDAIADNPVTKLPRETSEPGEIQVLTPDQLVELRKGVTEWQSGKINDQGKEMVRADGRSAGRAHDLLWFVDILLATGCRPGEVAALRWCDIDLTADTPTVLIAATTVSVSGAGLVRQEVTKASDIRLLSLPPYAVQTLAEMRQAQFTPIGTAPLFPTADGKHRDPGNIRHQWRRARRAAGRGDSKRFDWVDFRVMRRTVATVIDRAGSDEDAAAQLGHASTAMTRKHYILAKAAQAPDLTEVLERFAG